MSLGNFFGVRYKGFYAQLDNFCNLLTDLGWSWQRKADIIPMKTRIIFSNLDPISIVIVPDGTWGKALFCSRMNGTRNSNEAMIRISEGSCNCCLVGLGVGGKKNI